jgi:antitoxin HigA-1
VTRPALSAVLNERASLSPEMALRIEKAFGVSMDALMQMHTAHEVALMRTRSDEINIPPYTAKPAVTDNRAFCKRAPAS